MHEQHRVIPPIVANNQNGWISRRNHAEVSPADFRYFLAHPDDALGPIQHRVGIAALLCNIDVLVAVGTFIDDRRAWLVALCESALRLHRPLHWRAGAVALGQFKIVTHSDFVAIADHGRARQRAHQAVGEFETSAIAPEHRSEAPPDAPIVKLHVLVGTESFENDVTLGFGEAAEIEFVVISQEKPPLGAGWARFSRGQSLGKRT